MQRLNLFPYNISGTVLCTWGLGIGDWGLWFGCLVVWLFG